MRTLTEQDIRTRAYKLWKDAGQPNIKMDAFWYRAEKQLLQERAKEQRRSRAPKHRLDVEVARVS
jgi:hypothetical protein